VDELKALAARYVWWQSPEDTLARRDHFLCQLMTFATLEDMRLARAVLGDDAFREALTNAPPGIVARSWNFWHLLLFRRPPPPLPERPLP
jgi:hypothetical protein